MKRPNEYIEYESIGLERHIMTTQYCEHFYKENEVVTGIILELSTGQIKHNSSTPLTLLYNFERYSSYSLLDDV